MYTFFSTVERTQSKHGGKRDTPALKAGSFKVANPRTLFIFPSWISSRYSPAFFAVYKLCSYLT